eukprot:931138-Rhodomonas_salina.2
MAGKHSNFASIYGSSASVCGSDERVNGGRPVEPSNSNPKYSCSDCSTHARAHTHASRQRQRQRSRKAPPYLN